MTTTTFIATTAEGNTVARTSATKDYNFVILVNHSVGGNRENDDVEGAWGWSGDKANAEKTANTARKAYKSVRVVAVEQKLTGKEAKLVLDAIKAAPVEGANPASPIRLGAAPMGKVEAHPFTEAVQATTNTEEITVPTTATKPARKTAKGKIVEATPDLPAHVVIKSVDTEKVAQAESAEQAALGEYSVLLEALAEAQAKVAALLEMRNNRINELITAGTVSGPKLAKVMGVTPMAVYNMRAKATA
jgi:hypothetical protein